MSDQRVLFVALIARDNRPLYMQPFSPLEHELESVKHLKLKDSSVEPPPSFIEERNTNELLKYNFLSHMALDIFESPFFEPQENNRCSQLFVEDGVSVFGLLTSTGLKIVVGTDSKIDISERLDPLFAQIHRSYLRVIFNPFQSIDKQDLMINTPKFDSTIKTIVENWNTKST